MALYNDSAAVISTVIQYPDVTECTSSYQLNHRDCTSEWLLTKIKTEFAFATTAPAHGNGESEGVKGLIRNGFEPISAMNNWYPGHNGENRKIVFWWKRLRIGPDVVPCEPQTEDNRYAWLYDYHSPHLQRGGCGFKISEPPLITGQFWRFHTCLRMPKKLSTLRIKWLDRHNFRLFAIGTIADFWTNGWDPNTYSWEQVELPYWKEHGVHTNACEIIKAQVKPASPVKLA